MGNSSLFLFGAPSFLEGAASAFDLADSLTEFNSSLTPEQADRIAHAMDWRAIGNDLRRAVAQCGEELAQEQADVEEG